MGLSEILIQQIIRSTLRAVDMGGDGNRAVPSSFYGTHHPASAGELSASVENVHHDPPPSMTFEGEPTMVLPTHSSPHLEQGSSRGAGLLRIAGHGRHCTLSPRHGASMVPDTRRIGDHSRGKLGAKLHSIARPLLHDNYRPTKALPTEHDSSDVGFIQSSTVDNRSKQYTDHALGGHQPSKGVQRPGSWGQGRNNDHALSRDSFAKMTSSQTVLGEIQSQADGLEESSSESYMSDSDMGASDPQSEEEMEVQTYTDPLHEGGSCTSPRQASKLHKGMDPTEDFTFWKDKLKIVSATIKEKIP